MPIERLHYAKKTEPLLGHQPQSHAILLQPRTSSGSEIVPDSEEERQFVVSLDVLQPKPPPEIIEISSGEESEVERVGITHLVESSKTPSNRAPQTAKSATRLHIAHRRIIQSSDEACDAEIIEISDSSDDNIPSPKRSLSKTNSLDLNDDAKHPTTPSRPFVDESIIILDEPRGARTPLRVAPKGTSGIVTKGSANGSGQDLATPKKTRSLASLVLLGNTPGLSDGPAKGAAAKKVAGDKPHAAPPRPNTKKARLAAELLKRHEYAQQLFDDLNKAVFKGGLPDNTQLNWNKRLLTTAGKAKYHRSTQGVVTAEIELAEKILDCEERITNTLSHEMCHLATWIIDQRIDAHHGPLFKNWAAKVMKKRPEIEVSIKHDYQISHPYEWKCEKCAKIYGRFTNSIKTDECVCGACNEGALIPLFTSKRKPNTPQSSRMAASKPQDSPRALQNSSPAKRIGLESESESEIFLKLAKSLESTSLV
ncbi:hypothetical protein HYPSUDRAFT_211237 [Hypholoma sublateritium FD-334 SS-4]|uniref:SprT-like domain-containing protein n=1 Tax=Hypholoma sublateritium (strain FD-334 SS-4) TaxID=945553 RepID=A0A0D2PLZ2_HYPSF|nr:hypothetical protein HYPSUDRAFT_211237 [Hypholoma sublateritium FD-334 SS-4]